MTMMLGLWDEWCESMVGTFRRLMASARGIPNMSCRQHDVAFCRLGQIRHCEDTAVQEQGGGRCGLMSMGNYLIARLRRVCGNESQRGTEAR